MIRQFEDLIHLVDFLRHLIWVCTVWQLPVLGSPVFSGLTLYDTCPNSPLKKFILILVVVYEKWRISGSVYPDQMPHSIASDLCPHCLLRPVCLST